MTAICRFSNILQRLPVPRIKDQFRHKRCQKKRKDVDYKLLLEFFQEYFLVHKRLAVKNSFSKYMRMLYIGRYTYLGWICNLMFWGGKNATYFDTYFKDICFALFRVMFYNSASHDRKTSRTMFKFFFELFEKRWNNKKIWSEKKRL